MQFNQKVWQLTKRIPKGKVSTYKEIARKMGTKAYRAVGNALNKNRSKKVPCHRVVRSDGFVGGFVKGTKKKAEMLKREGIYIKKWKIENFRRKLYKF